jgi:hypothetical protein
MDLWLSVGLTANGKAYFIVMYILKCVETAFVIGRGSGAESHKLYKGDKQISRGSGPVTRMLVIRSP